mmetsp:Transcript_23714/g.66969  ORF Transcript_23714/g.66969 Transcript_23714/m.66969 type:complete len:823 (-) Transcript_23714:66-2534(-)
MELRLTLTPLLLILLCINSERGLATKSSNGQSETELEQQLQQQQKREQAADVKVDDATTLRDEHEQHDPTQPQVDAGVDAKTNADVIPSDDGDGENADIRGELPPEATADQHENMERQRAPQAETEHGNPRYHTMVSSQELHHFIRTVANMASENENVMYSNLVAVFVYRTSCKPCVAFYDRMIQAISMVRSTIHKTLHDIDGRILFDESAMVVKQPWFGGINLDDIEDQAQMEDFAKELSISDVPAIFFVDANEATNNNITRYSGSMDSADDIRNGMLHYVTRILPAWFDYVSMPQTPDTHYMELHPAYFSELSQLNSYIEQYHFNVEEGMLFNTIRTKYNPHYSQNEVDTIRYMLHGDAIGDENTNAIPDDPNYVFVQCQLFDYETPPASYTEFIRFATIMFDTQRAFFATTIDCQEDEDEVVALFLVDDAIKKIELRSTWTPRAPYETKGSMSSMHNFIVTALTPSVMWLDRESTAPIAFREQVNVHAVLFVDFHHPRGKDDVSWSDEVKESRQAIDALREICREHSANYLTDFTDAQWREAASPAVHEPMACLVVPSTDVRVLTAFGVDIWSSIDEWACRQGQGEVDDDEGDDKLQPAAGERKLQQELPVLQITDSRDAASTKRYRMEGSPCDEDHMRPLFQKFWDDQLAPEVKSSKTRDDMKEGPFHNKYDVESVYALNFEQRIVKSHSHVLLLVTSPTCGHSKRTSVVWNELSELVRYLEWQSWLQVAKMDGTTEEVHLDGMVVNSFPSIFYFPPDHEGSQRPNRFDQIGVLGEEVGILNDPTDVLLWLFEVADGIDHQKALELVESMIELAATEE